jgi:hypothetical protein
VDPVYAVARQWLTEQASRSEARGREQWLLQADVVNALTRAVQAGMADAVVHVVTPEQHDEVMSAMVGEGARGAEVDVPIGLGLPDSVIEVLSPRFERFTDQGLVIDRGALSDALTHHVRRHIEIDAVRGGPLRPHADLLLSLVPPGPPVVIDIDGDEDEDEDDDPLAGPAR